jgi:hypothetical protein
VGIDNDQGRQGWEREVKFYIPLKWDEVKVSNYLILNMILKLTHHTNVKFFTSEY